MKLSLTSGPIYRPMLWHALKTAWGHKELWPLAVLAGVAGSGVIVNDLLQQAQFALHPSSSALNAIGGDIGLFIQRYAALVLSSGTASILYATLGLILILIGCTYLVVLCQQMLIVTLDRALHQKVRLTGRDLLRSLKHHHLLRILGVNLIFHVAIFLVLGGGAMLLRYLPIELASGATVAILLLAIILFAAFVLNIVEMFTLIAVGKEHVSITRGFKEGVQRFLRHPLVACEMSILIFAANLGLSIAYLFGLAALSIPFGLLFAEALGNNSMVQMAVIAFVGAISTLFYTLCAVGFMTTFTYCTWMNLAEYLNKKPFTSRFHHHITKRFTR